MKRIGSVLSMLCFGMIFGAPACAPPPIELATQYSTCSGVERGETFFDESFTFNLPSGFRVILSSTPEGDGSFSVDDGIRLTTNLDVFEHDFSNGCRPIEALAPREVTGLFSTGDNLLRVELFDICGTCEGNSDLWLTFVAEES